MDALCAEDAKRQLQEDMGANYREEKPVDLGSTFPEVPSAEPVFAHSASTSEGSDVASTSKEKNNSNEKIATSL